MPKLRKMELTVDQEECDRATLPVGLEHLSMSLKEIKLYGAKPLNIDVPGEAKAKFDKFREAVNAFPSPVAFDISEAGVLW